MILADKIIKQRKKNGWSQEELAEKMDVSRQAVSKWESAQSTPDLEKILQLANLFGVTTDYLLKDDIEEEEYTDVEITEVKKVSLATANAFLGERKRASIRIAVATMLCIFSPIPLILLSSAAEFSFINISEPLAAGIGLTALLFIISLGVGLFIYTGFLSDPYKHIEKGEFENEYGVEGMVREKQSAFRNTYIKLNIAGSCICVLSPAAIVCSSFTENAFLIAVMTTVTMIIAGIGAMLFIIAGVRDASMKKLLREGDFEKDKKKKERDPLRKAVSSIYWSVITAIYLAWSFIFSAWHISWIIWPISSALSSGIFALVDIISTKKNK